MIIKDELLVLNFSCSSLILIVTFLNLKQKSMFHVKRNIVYSINVCNKIRMKLVSNDLSTLKTVLDSAVQTNMHVLIYASNVSCHKLINIKLYFNKLSSNISVLLCSFKSICDMSMKNCNNRKKYI